MPARAKSTTGGVYEKAKQEDERRAMKVRRTRNELDARMPRQGKD